MQQPIGAMAASFACASRISLACTMRDLSPVRSAAGATSLLYPSATVSTASIVTRSDWLSVYSVRGCIIAPYAACSFTIFGRSSTFAMGRSPLPDPRRSYLLAGGGDER